MKGTQINLPHCPASQFEVDSEGIDYATAGAKKERGVAMDDVALREQFKINAMHGHDVGVWVCEGSGMFLSPVLFMQALCPDPAPRSLFVKWKSASVPPKAFRKDGVLPLVYSECGRLPAWPYHLHLFAPQAPIAAAVEQESGLQDWSWAVPVIGIILIYDRKYDRSSSIFSLNRLLDRSKSPPSNALLAWVQAQQLPYVIAALDYGDTLDSLPQFRKRYNLAADVPVMPGPALVDARQRNQDADNSGSLSSMFARRKLAIDQEYARTVLDALLQQIGRERAAQSK